MAEKISAIMATEVALDVTPANRSLRSLKQSVSIVNKSIKAQSANLAGMGNAYEAARARADGLNGVIQKQEQVVARLEAQQRHQMEVARDQQGTIARLKDEIKETKEAREAEAKSAGTESSRYKELTEDLHNYQSSLREANQIDRRLMSTSNQLESARLKLGRFRSEQRSADIESRSLSTSGWKRVGDAVLAANRHIQDTRQEVGGLRGVFMGTFAGTALVSGAQAAWGTIKQGIGGAITAGTDFDKKQQVMQASWETLMDSSSKAENMRKSIIDMSNALGQPVELTDELSQQFYHVFDNQPETEKLTRSFLTMGDAIGLSSDRLQQVGMDFTHMLSASKLQLGDLNQITDAFPMFGNALLNYERQIQHNGALTMADLRKQISAGKIQSKDAEVVMNQLGQKYKQSSENLMSTLPGMARQIKAKVKQLSGDVMNPILQQQSPIYQTVSNWVKDPNTDAEFKALGGKVNQGMQTVMRAFGGGGNPATITNALNRGVQILGNTVTTVANWIARNAQTIRASFNLMGAAGRAGFAVLGAAIRTVIAMLNLFTGGTRKSGSQSRSTAAQLNNLANSLNRLSQNRSRVQMLGRVLATVFVVSKVARFARVIGGLASSIAGPLVGAVARGVMAFRSGAGAVRIFGAALRIGPWGIAAVAIGAIAIALIALYRHSQKFRDFMHGLWVITKTIGSAIIKTFPAYWMMKGLQKLYRQSPAFRAFVNGMARVVRTVFGTLFKWLKDALGAIWKGLKWAYNKVADIGRSGSIKNPSKKYASGTSGASGEFAVVNDAQSQHYREMLYYRGLLMPFSKKRNQVAYIPAGAEVIDGETAHNLAKRQGLKHYASGSGELSSYISGLNDYGSGNRRQIAAAFLRKLNEQFEKQLKQFQEQISKAQQQAAQTIAKAQQTLHERLAKARESMTTRITKAQQSARDRMAKAQQRLTQRLAEIAQSANERRQTAEKTKQDKYARAKESLADREGRADMSYQSRMQKANDSWKKQQDKYKDDPEKLAKYREKHNQRVAAINASYAKSIDSAWNSFTSSVNAGQQAYNKAIQTLTTSTQKSTATAQSTFANTNNKARTSLNNAINSARSSFATTTAKANQTARTRIGNARATENRKVGLANTNISRLKAWRQNNIDQLYAGFATYAHGGIADRPAIFGEAGLEAAIPMDAMKSGDAWQTLQKVINFYAGNADTSAQPQQQGASIDQDKLFGMFGEMLTYMKAMVQGQSAQVEATKGINGYDASKAFDDFSKNLAYADASSLVQ